MSPGQDSTTRGSAVVRLYYAVHRALEGYTRLLNVVNNGFWLGVLDRRQLHAIGQRKYSKAHYYYTDEYNKKGLWDWESPVVARDFSGCSKVLLAAAGGGREVLALRRLGMEVDGFECDPKLLDFANELLAREGLAPDLKPAPWDRCPDLEGTYDGVIVGWGAYMLIRGRAQRIRFLRELRDRVAAGSPILLSFNTTGEYSRFFRGVSKIGSALARVLGREPVELGDSLTPNYEHYFTRQQVESEMLEGGFQPIRYDNYPFGHSVGRAV